MISSSALTPKRLRLILLASLTLIILAGAGIFYLAYGRLSKTATETGSSVAQARESQDMLERLRRLKQELESKKEIVDRTSLVTANSANYSYQDLLVRDLTTYADRAQLTIKNISFSSQAAASTPAPAVEGGAVDGAAPAGLNKATVDITLETPVNYVNLLNFLHYIEQNLTKLKVSKVSMTKGDTGTVTIDVLNLEVYIQ